MRGRIWAGSFAPTRRSHISIQRVFLTEKQNCLCSYSVLFSLRQTSVLVNSVRTYSSDKPTVCCRGIALPIPRSVDDTSRWHGKTTRSRLNAPTVMIRSIGFHNNCDMFTTRRGKLLLYFGGDERKKNVYIRLSHTYTHSQTHINEYKEEVVVYHPAVSCATRRCIDCRR